MERSGELEEDGDEALGGGFRDFGGEDAKAGVAATEVAAGLVLVVVAEGGAGQGGLAAESGGVEAAVDVLALGHGGSPFRDCGLARRRKKKRPATVGRPFCTLYYQFIEAGGNYRQKSWGNALRQFPYDCELSEINQAQLFLTEKLH